MLTDPKAPQSQAGASKSYQETEKVKEWREGFEAQSLDPESTDISYVFAAQADVVLRERAAAEI